MTSAPMTPRSPAAGRVQASAADGRQRQAEADADDAELEGDPDIGQGSVPGAPDEGEAERSQQQAGLGGAVRAEAFGQAAAQPGGQGHGNRQTTQQ